MKHKYVVCISSDTQLNQSILDELALSQNVIFVEKVYSEIESTSEFEKAWQNGTEAITEREAYYNDLNKVFMGMITLLQKQGVVTADGQIHLEEYTTASIVHFATKIVKLGIKALNDNAQKINNEVKEAKECLKKGKTPEGNLLTPEGLAHYQDVLDKHPDKPFKIGAALQVSIEMLLSALNNAFDDGGKAIDFDLQQVHDDMAPLGDIMAKWCSKAAFGSPVVINFLRDANLLTEDDLAKLATNE